MLSEIITAWLTVTLLVTFYYAMLCYFKTAMAIQSFSGTDQSYDVPTKQLTKRLGIVYAFWVFAGSVVLYILVSDSSWTRFLQSFMLLINALYSSSLCYLVSRNKFWASDAVKKNVPFVGLNIILLMLLQFN